MNFEENTTIIKESLQTIVRYLDASPKARASNDIKTTASKIYNILLQDRTPIERFYFIHLICHLCIDAKPAKVDKLMKIILPSQPTAHSMTLISDLISFAVCHPSVYTSILDNMSAYLSISDLISIDVESWYQAETLALDSPTFCSALLSRSDLSRMNIDKKLLARWLQDLSKTDKDFPVPSLNQLIKYSLFHPPPVELPEEILHRLELANSDFHLGILTLIQSKRCQTLTNQFLMEVVSTLVQHTSGHDETKNKHQATALVDRFAQILSVSAASKVTTITNALRNSLTKLDSNQLIASVIRWQNKFS